MEIIRCGIKSINRVLTYNLSYYQDIDNEYCGCDVNYGNENACGCDVNYNDDNDCGCDD